MTVSAYERARLSRDARFDGRFFVAVSSTGIYCRPVCPARQPKSRNIRFYDTAAAAEEAGWGPWRAYAAMILWKKYGTNRKKRKRK